MLLDKKIVSFIRKHHVMTIATVDGGGQPYCANMFYAWVAEAECFVFTSDHTTRHAREALQQSHIAASIVLETKVVGKVQGLQITGVMQPAEQTQFAEVSRQAYLKRFPYAALAELSLWVVEPHYLKLTDNTLGFGKKLIWQRDGEDA